MTTIDDIKALMLELVAELQSTRELLSETTQSAEAFADSFGETAEILQKTQKRNWGKVYHAASDAEIIIVEGS